MKQFLKTFWAGLGTLLTFLAVTAIICGSILVTAWAIQFVWFSVTLGVVALIFVIWFIGSIAED